MKEIREWLEGGQPYAQGVALYETHGKSRVVLKTLRYGATEFTRATLRRELAKLVAEKGTGEVEKGSRLPKQQCADQQIVRQSAPGNGTKQVTEKVASSPEKVASLSDRVDSSADERRQRSTWYAERDRLHAQLELVATDAERRVMAERILDLSALISESYEEPGTVAAPTPALDVAQLDQGEIRRRLANRRCLASKLKKNPARALDLAQVLADINLLEANVKKNRDGGKSQLQPRH